ncbi:MAG: hypothetical protein M5U16_04755 [Hyphomicrobium sp.]|nr:hypothetical protein [Hyphomicrobium sp.]
MNSIEAELKVGRYETRLGNLEQKVFGAPRRWSSPRGQTAAL